MCSIIYCSTTSSLLPFVHVLYPGNVHGGAVASALDDILGTMVWRNAGFSSAGIPTLELTVTYRDPVPLQRQLRFDTEVVKWEGRKVCENSTKAMRLEEA